MSVNLESTVSFSVPHMRIKQWTEKAEEMLENASLEDKDARF